MIHSEHLARLLSANPFFGRLESNALREIAGLCVTCTLSQNETLFSKGDPGDALYAVRRGEIRIGVVDDVGRRMTFNILGSGDIFGEIALLDGRPRTADAIAAQPTELLVVRRRDLLGMLARHPSLAIHLIELLCGRLRWISGRMEEAVLLPLPARLARRLLALHEDYGAELDISQEALAVYVGSTRESVNRQLQAWRRHGIVEIGRGRIRIIDAARLTDATEPEGGPQTAPA